MFLMVRSEAGRLFQRPEERHYCNDAGRQKRRFDSFFRLGFHIGSAMET